MASLRGKPSQPGYSQLVAPDSSDMTYIEFGLLSLRGGGSWEHGFPGRECLLVLLGGKCDLAAGGKSWQTIGQRRDVFDGRPTAVYLPPGESFRVTAPHQVEIAVCLARAEKGPEVTLIAPDQVGVRSVGRGSFQRSIHDIAVIGGLDCQRMLVGETYNPPGLWSSYPPHKHDVHSPPAESKLEEVYHFRVKPPQGFGIQRVYGEGFDESYAVQDRDTVTIARGYHPVVAAPGYQLYYLWILAGEQRIMHPRDDQAHAWVHKEGP